MPTLIRLIVFLIFLAGLGFGGMVALTAVVDPGEKEIRVRIPSRDLMMTNESGDTVTLRDQLPAPKMTDSTDLPAEQPPAATSNKPPADMSTFE